jgi:hypothetical protein
MEVVRMGIKRPYTGHVEPLCPYCGKKMVRYGLEEWLYSGPPDQPDSGSSVDTCEESMYGPWKCEEACRGTHASPAGAPLYWASEEEKKAFMGALRWWEDRAREAEVLPVRKPGEPAPEPRKKRDGWSAPPYQKKPDRSADMAAYLASRNGCKNCRHYAGVRKRVHRCDLSPESGIDTLKGACEHWQEM